MALSVNDIARDVSTIWDFQLNIRSLFLIPTLAIVLLSACSVNPEQEQIQAEAGDIPFSQVFYGTNRNVLDSDKSARRYGQDRGAYALGTVEVTGYRSEDKTRVASVNPLSPADFGRQLRGAVAAAQAPELMVFVHGFLRSFDQVARLVAEFSESTDFVGVPVMWSWPSTSNPARYTVDETNIDWAMPEFARFLQTLLEESGASKIHLVGHSLGGRGLSKVFVHHLLPAGLDVSALGQFVLLAPDIDQEIFLHQYAPVLVAAGLDVSLYTSANDKAMASARAVHGYPRAGDSAGGPLLYPGIETVDVTSANRSFLGHSYFDESEVVARDLGLLLNTREPAAQRPGVERVVTGHGVYWRLLPVERAELSP